MRTVKLVRILFVAAFFTYSVIFITLGWIGILAAISSTIINHTLLCLLVSNDVHDDLYLDYFDTAFSYDEWRTYNNIIGSVPRSRVFVSLLLLINPAPLFPQKKGR